MMRYKFQTLIAAAVLLYLFALALPLPSVSPAFAQQPTETTSTGMFITVVTDEPQINVRMGPSSTVYPVVGILLTGSTAPALGRSIGGDWIQIEFPSAPDGKGWVYSPLVQVSSPGTLQVVDSPPTPVPPATSTIDPTLAAQFVIVPTTTRLPTYTPPPPLTTPSYIQQDAAGKAPLQLAAIIIAFAVLGLIGFVLSLVRR